MKSTIEELRETLRAHREAERALRELRARQVELLERAVRDGTPMLRVAYALKNEFGCAATACVFKLRRRLNKELERARKRGSAGDNVSPHLGADGLPPMFEPVTMGAEVATMPKQIVRETTTTTTKEYVDTDTELDDVEDVDEDEGESQGEPSRRSPPRRRR